MKKFEALPSTNFKSILCEIYTNSNDRIVYHNITNRLKKYLSMINKGISEEGYTLREKLLERIDNAVNNKA